jgi:hypothetical protein
VPILLSGKYSLAICAQDPSRVISRTGTKDVQTSTSTFTGEDVNATYDTAYFSGFPFDGQCPLAGSDHGGNLRCIFCTRNETMALVGFLLLVSEGGLICP